MGTVTSSASLLWIEGNTNDEVHVVPSTVTCTYNVDKPEMWTPLSVLSGIASGFCERKAALNTVFATGATWGANTSAGIVSNCMHGFALGSIGDAALFGENNCVFLTAGTAGGVDNYMASVDSAIGALITGTTTQHFVKPDGTDYLANGSPISGLASAADARADIAEDPTSSIELPGRNGGGLNGTGRIAFPVEWAKQRKWMLDELRYINETQTIITPTSVYRPAATWEGKATPPGESYQSEQRDVNLVVNSAYAAIGTEVESRISADTGATTVLYKYSYLSDRTIIPANWGSSSYADAETKTVEYPGAVVSLTRPGDDAIVTEDYYMKLAYMADSADYSVIQSQTVSGTLPSSLQLTGESIGGQTIPVDVFLGEPTGDSYAESPFLSSYIHPKTIYVSGATTFTANAVSDLNTSGGAIIVLSAGTATIAAGCTVSTMIVEPGGSAVLATNTSLIGKCCVITSIPNDAALNDAPPGVVVGRNKTGAGIQPVDKIDAFYQDFVLVYSKGDYAYHAVSETSNDTTLLASDAVIIIQDGATYTLTDVGKSSKVLELRVESGGSLKISATGGTATTFLYSCTCNILAGGRATIAGNSIWLGYADPIGSGGVVVHSGGYCEIIGAPVGTGDNYSSASISLRDLTIENGGTCVINKYVRYAPITQVPNANGTLSAGSGALLKLVSNTTVPAAATAYTVVSTPIDIMKWKIQHDNEPSLSVITIFNACGLQTDITDSDTVLESGWNRTSMTVPTGETVGYIAARPAAAEVVFEPVKQILFIGTQQNNSLDPVILYEGFSVRAVRLVTLGGTTTTTGLINHYLDFHVRQWAADKTAQTT